MTAANRWSLYPSAFSIDGGADFNLTQVAGVNVVPNSNIIGFIAGGSVDQAAILGMNSDHAVTFMTQDLSSLFANISGSTGACLDSASIFYQSRSDCGTFEAGAVHDKIDLTKGFIFPTTVSASQDELARADLLLKPLWDGTNEPLVRTSNVALGAGTPAYNSSYTLGPVYLSAAELVGIQSLSVDFGLAFSIKRTSGDPHGKIGCIVARRPSITFTTLKHDYATTAMTIAALPDSFNGYLWKMTDCGTRVAKNVGSHILFSVSAANGCWNPESMDVSAGDDNTVSIRVYVKGTIGVNTSSTIP